MKKLLLLIVAVVAALAVCYGGAVAIDNHYKSELKQKQAQAVPTISVKQSNANVEAVKVSAVGEYKALVVQYNGQVAECQKGLVAYAKLTPALKAQTPVPTCGTPQ